MWNTECTTSAQRLWNENVQLVIYKILDLGNVRVEQCDLRAGKIKNITDNNRSFTYNFTLNFYALKASPARGAKFIKSKFQLILQMKIKIREEKKRKKMCNNVKNKKDRFG